MAEPNANSEKKYKERHREIEIKRNITTTKYSVTKVVQPPRKGGI